jgi:4-hydroxy-tetrahydrodipicolinate synthase
MKHFGSVITAMVTPFKENGDLHLNEAVRLGHYLFDSGTDTLLLTGTTGESPTLSHEEERELYKTFVGAFDAAKLMAGTGSNCTKTAVESTQKAEAIGIGASLQVVPYYNKPSQKGLYAHFKTIAENTGLPIMLYNIPSRTGISLNSETIGALSQIPNIVSIKEASGKSRSVVDIRAYSTPDFSIYCGDDALLVDYMKEGAVGIVSVASHLVGRQLQEMIRFIDTGDVCRAEALSETLMPLFQALFITSNPVPIKEALKRIGFDVGNTRLPLIGMDASELDILKKAVSDCPFI